MTEKNMLFLTIVFFLAVFVLFSSGRFGGDGLDNYLTAESIVLDGDFTIHDRPFEVEEMSYSKRGVTGPEVQRTSQYGLGVALLLVPFYFAGHVLSVFFSNVQHAYITQVAVSLYNPVILALLAGLLFRLLSKLGYSSRVSFIVVSIYSLCTMNIVYARSGFSEPTVALLILFGAMAMFDYHRSGNVRSLIIAAASIAYALFIKKNSVMLVPAFGLYGVYLILSESAKSLKSKLVHLVYFMLPFLFAAIAILIQNNVLYGGMLNTEYGTVTDMAAKVRTDGYPIKGLYYYLISSGKGYLIYNAALFLGLFAIRDFIRKNRLYAFFVLALLLSNLLGYSFIFVRGSLFSWGPRYLFPTLPLFALMLAEYMRTREGRGVKISVGVFAVAGFLIQLPNLFINFSKYLFFVKEKLVLPEYLINFMPELSPIKGAWMLFLSMFSRVITGQSLSFSYNPDLWFFEKVSSPLTGYDSIDIVWANVLKVTPGFAAPVYVGCALVGVVIVISACAIIKKLKTQDQ